MVRSLLRCKEGFERFCCIGGYVCHRRLEGCRILSLVSEPGVNDLFCLYKFPLFSWRKFSLIHFLVLSVLIFTAMPSIALASTALEPYETLIHEDGTLPKDIAILMSFGVSEADARRYVGDMYMDGQPKFEQLCGRTYLKNDNPSGPWVTDLGEAYILAAKAEWEQTGGGGGGHAIGGDDGGGGGGAGHSFGTNVLSNVVEMTPFDASASRSYRVDETVSSSDAIVFYKLGNVSYYPRLANRTTAQKFKITIPDSEVANIADYFSRNGNGVCIVSMDNRDGYSVNVCCIPKDTIRYVPCDGGGCCRLFNSRSTGDEIYSHSSRYTGRPNSLSWPNDIEGLKDAPFNFNNVQWYGVYRATASSDSDDNSTSNYGVAYAVFYAKDGVIYQKPDNDEPSGGGDDNPSGGGDDNPSGGGDDEPSAPTPPEIDPTEYTTYEGDNTDVTVTVTFNNDGGQTDLTPITTRLDRIYARLGDIGRDLLNFDQHVQSAFYSLENKLDGLFSSYLGSVKTWLEMIYNRVDDINRNIGNLDKSTDDLADLSVIEHQLRDLVDADGVTLTVHGLLHWINYYLQDIDRFLHDWNPYETIDYSTVLGNIYDEFSDYTSSFSQFWSDLNGKLNTIITDLENLKFAPRYPTNPYPRPPSNPETGIVPWEDMLNINALRDAITRMMQKFPFATINNFVLILTMLVRPAQAPQFDLPLPNPSDWSDPYLVHVDLSVWDVPAAILRTGTMLWAIARVSRRTVALWTSEEGGGEGA